MKFTNISLTKEKNNPHVGTVTSKTESPKVQIKKYQYDPHLDPQLQWAGKTERLSFEVPSSSLHVDERIDPRSIIETVRTRNSVDYEQMSLFHDPQNKISADKEAEFYKHEKLWSNRLIAGDSLLVMNSLLEKEGMGGKIQCIYIDPPYGIKYGSNFQPFTNKRDVKNKDENLTAEPEMLKAFRDTWELGIHSYLTYMRDRLSLAKELLTESGSCFVQISDENVHHVREIMDEVFGKENFATQIYFATTSGFQGDSLSRIGDYLIWYFKSKNHYKYHQLFKEKKGLEAGNDVYKHLELSDGTRRPMSKEERSGHKTLPKNSRIFCYSDLQSTNAAKDDTPFEFEGKIYRPNPNNHWKAKYPEGMENLKNNKRIGIVGNKLRYIRFITDKPVNPISNSWMDTSFAGFSSDKRYIVETNKKVIQRCLLMTTDPGDIVFDPTCGSGTTAYVAEQWGRRWITCDTSRVSIALAKQRLMTANFDYYELKNEKEGIDSGFNYKTVPHITLKSIANNDPPQEETGSNKAFKKEVLKKLHTIGQPGLDGHHIHHVIAVSMLSEGWDCKTVTHIMGLRAFSSQLLCEQTVGRGLRRTHHELNNEGMFDPEFVSVLGVPFSYLPQEEDSERIRAEAPKNCIFPEDEKSEYAITWPNVERVDRILKPELKIDFKKMEIFKIDVSSIPRINEIAPIIENNPRYEDIETTSLQEFFEKNNQPDRMQTLILKITSEVYEKKDPAWKSKILKKEAIKQIFQLVEKFIVSSKFKIIPEYEKERKSLVVMMKMNEIVNKVFNLIQRHSIEKLSVVYGTPKFSSTSDGSEWWTKKSTSIFKKTHMNLCVTDSGWEQSHARELDKNKFVEAWVKNDHLGFEVDYIDENGKQRIYIPDFIIRLTNGEYIILEVKGKKKKRDIQKWDFMENWCKAVSQDLDQKWHFKISQDSTGGMIHKIIEDIYS